MKMLPATTTTTFASRIGLEIDSDQVVEIRFCPGTSGGTLSIALVSPDVRDPGASVLEDGLSSAAAWFLELDSRAKMTLVRRGRTELTIPSPTRAVEPLDPGLTGNDYWDRRVDPGYLIRPLLLRAPDLGTLYRFQLEGVRWLVETEAAILADDMGLGKTAQILTAARMLVRKGEARQIVVVAPSSLLATWESETARWAPELVAVRMTPRGADRDGAWRAMLGRAHILVTNYEQLRSLPASLERAGCDVLVVDEAHRIRNLSAAITRSTMVVPRRWFWAMTGTPIEREATDLATILAVASPTRFSPRDAAAGPIALRSRARSHVKRRRKADVLDQLPDVLDRREVLDLSEEQAVAYREAISAARDDLENPGRFLALVIRLRGICDVDEASGASSKASRIVEILDSIPDPEKAVVFSYLLAPLNALEDRLRSRETECVRVDGSMTRAERDLAIERFRMDPTVRILLASSRVASEGLTLVEANHVIFFNEWWNPSSNDQARDRVVRIGQERNVTVHRFTCKGTIEESLVAILARKRLTFEEIVEALGETSKSVRQDILSELRDSVRRSF